MSNNLVNNLSSLLLKHTKTKKKKSKTSSSSSSHALSSLSSKYDNVSSRINMAVRKFSQLTNAPLANINVSTGGVTATNSTGSLSLIRSANVTVSDPTFSMFHTLADLPQATTFTALFDQYRIVKVETTFTTTASQVGVWDSTAAAKLVPNQLWYHVDVDDANPPSSLRDLMETESTNVVDLNTTPSITVSYTPRVAVSAYQGAFSGYANQTSWVDCGSPSVQHYGLKWGMPAVPSLSGFFPSAISVVCRYHIEFRGVR